MKIPRYVLAFLLLGIPLRAADIDTSIQDLGEEVSVTTATEQEATSLINQSNATKSGLFVGAILSAKAGDTVTFPITLIPGPKPIAALQADVMLSPGISIVSMVAGPTSIAAGKSVSFSGNPSNPVLVFGLNQSPIGNGVVVIATLKLASTLGPGLYPVVFSNPVASDPSGTGVPICVTSGLLEVK